jgi:hypothetical protein
MDFPVDFQKKAALPPPADGNGYPYQISARDLMENLKFAALEVEPTTKGGIALKETVENGIRKISLVIPVMPTTGTHVLGAVNGVLQWIETTECE